MNAMSHWVDGRAGRPLHLTFAQVGSQLSAQIPADLVVAPPGYYLLFAMVDDIRSECRIVAAGYPDASYLPAIMH